MAMIIGYARVSTDEQKLDLQLRALEQAGCARIFTDQGLSGSTFDRAGLDDVLQNVEPGSTLVVWRLDRLGRSLSGLVRFIDDLGKRQVNFRSVTEAIDTTTSSGRLMFHVIAALAEFERSLISERTRAGMAVAREKGKHVGRPKSLTSDQIKYARCAIRCNRLCVDRVADQLNVSTRTLRRHIGNCADSEINGPFCSKRKSSADG